MNVDTELLKIGEDLLNLEVNTIIKSGMTGMKMPTPYLAILQVYCKYTKKLTELYGKQFADCFDVGKGYKSLPEINELQPNDPAKLSKSCLPGVACEKCRQPFAKFDGVVCTCRICYAQENQCGVFDQVSTNEMVGALKSAFEIIGRFAANINTIEPNSRNCDTVEEIDENKKYVLLHRIQKGSGEVVRILDIVIKNKNKPGLYGDFREKGFICNLPFGDLVQIRKVWELGSEDIVAQTIVQLDGDIITRISTKYARPEYATLHSFHGQMVDTSIKFWGQLVQLVTGTLSSLLQLLKKR